MMTLGQLLKDSRTRLGLSLRDVERQTRISNGHLSLLESGAVQRPSPNLLEKLSALYGVSYSLLMELAGYRTPEPVSNIGSGMDDIADLTALEREQVRHFVGYLRSTRSATLSPASTSARNASKD
jgi:transcriptional regulator with XRE-family HTH domain